MRIALTGGGTGGHIFPNIAVADEVKVKSSAFAKATAGKQKLNLKFDFFYIGGKNSVEEKIMKEYGMPFYGISVGKLRRYFDLQNIIDAFKVPVGIFEAYRILKKIKPDLVFAKGGYVSVPVVLAARLLRIPIWLHESDVSPGLSTKICMRFAEKIFLSFEESKEFFRNKTNIEVVGNPIREFILKGEKNKGYELTGFSSNKPVVLVMGGSSGAASLNEMIFEILPKLTKEAQVVHITGNGERGTGRIHNYKPFEFIAADLPHVYAIADVVVSRAGSGSIFELLALGKPMILIPLQRGASRGDQVENAEIFAKRGYARVLYQDKLAPPFLRIGVPPLRRQPQDLLDEILATLKSKHHTHKVHEFKNAAKKIAEEILARKI